MLLEKSNGACYHWKTTGSGLVLLKVTRQQYIKLTFEKCLAKREMDCLSGLEKNNKKHPLQFTHCLEAEYLCLSPRLSDPHSSSAVYLKTAENLRDTAP